MIITCLSWDLVSTVSWFSWLDFDFLDLVLEEDFEAAAAAKSLKLMSWFENSMLPNEEAANELVLLVEVGFLLANCCCSKRLTCWWLSKKWWLFETLDDDVVDVDEETDEDSKAAGVKSNGNVVGDIGGSEDVVDLEEVDDDVDEDRDDLDDNVEAADEDEWWDADDDEEEFEDEDEYCLRSLFSFLLNVKWLGFSIRFEVESLK